MPLAEPGKNHRRFPVADRADCGTGGAIYPIGLHQLAAVAFLSAALYPESCCAAASATRSSPCGYQCWLIVWECRGTLIFSRLARARFADARFADARSYTSRLAAGNPGETGEVFWGHTYLLRLLPKSPCAEAASLAPRALICALPGIVSLFITRLVPECCDHRHSHRPLRTRAVAFLRLGNPLRGIQLLEDFRLSLLNVPICTRQGEEGLLNELHQWHPLLPGPRRAAPIHAQQPAPP